MTRSDARRHGGAALTLAALLLVALPGAARGAPATVAPDADTYVNAAKPSSNFGTSRKLNVDASPVVRAYLRFTVPALGSPVARATLRLRALSSTTKTVTIHPVADTTWGERTITYNTAPAAGAAASSATGFAAGPVDFDVTSLVSGAGAIAFMVDTTSTSTISFASREDAAGVPQLLVETAGGDTTPPAVTLDTPVNGAVTADATPAFAGGAGTAPGDSGVVTARVYSGPVATGLPVQEVSTIQSAGRWTVDAASPLADGVYTVRAEQADDAGNTGLSAAHSFTVDTAPQPCSPSGYAALVASEPGVIGHWRLGEATGTAASDTVGGNHGTYTGGVTLGRAGAIACDPSTAVGLDGTSGHVAVAGTAPVNPSAAMSLEAWVRPAGVSARQTIARKDGAYLLRVFDGALRFRLWWTSGSSTEVIGPAGLRAGEYQHVVASYDGAAMRVYVDGAEVVAKAAIGTIASTTSTLRFGASGTYDFLQGDLDEVAIYGAALTPARIAQHHATGTGTAPPNPPPTAPAGLSATPGPGTVALAWGAASDDDLAGYRVYRRLSGGPWPAAPMATVPAGQRDYVDSTVAAGATYGYRVTAFDAVGGESDPSGEATATVPDAPESVVLAAGDIAGCDTLGDEATAAILDGEAGTVLALGDLAYENGTAQEFQDCYGPSWGRHKARTRPTPGNHEYRSTGAAPYFDYFGAAAGPSGSGYYSFDLGSWHVVALNSNCGAAGGCGAGSPQEQWLRADLAASNAPCTMAFWHHARFSSDATHPSDPTFSAFWQALHDDGADVVLVGHSHTYERFAPQSAAGAADPTGPRQFVAGTGGRSHYSFGTVVSNSEVRHSGTGGVLRLTLRPGGYEWRFLPVAGASFTDSGSASC